MCLESIEELEKEKMTMKEKKTKLQLKDEWPQLKYATKWMMENKIEGATNLLNMIICRRRREIECEERERSEEE